MKIIPIENYLIFVKRENCPLPEELKIGKEITWTDKSKVRCSGCVYLKGVSLKNTNFQYTGDGCSVEVGEPKESFCTYESE